MDAPSSGHEVVDASAGGVTVSYFGWGQNREDTHWTEGEVATRLEQRMVTAFDETWAFASDHGSSLRLAALSLGVRRVADAIQQRARSMGLSA